MNLIRKYSFLSVAFLFLSGYALSDSVPQKVQVLIIGGGIAGTSTAYRLEKAGIEFQLLESTSRLGGRSKTASYPGGASAEVGLEEFWEGNPTLDIIRELKLPIESSASSFSTLVYQGKVYPFVQETNIDFLHSFLDEFEVTKYQEWDRQVTEIYQRIKNKEINAELLKLKEISFEEWISHEKFGLSKKTLEFIRIESEPEYGSQWSSIGALDGIAEWHIFGGQGRASFHVVAGNQNVAQSIAAKLGTSRFSLNMQVTNVNQKSDYIEVIATDVATFEQKIYHTSYVVSTVPLFRLNEIQFTPALSAERQQAIQTQTWGAYFTAHVFVDKEAAQYWTVGSEEVLPILSDSSAGVIYGGHSSKDSPYRLLNLLVTGDSAEIFNSRTMSFDEVNEAIRASLDKLWTGFSKYIQRITFYRYHPRAIAGWPVGRSRFDGLSDLMRTPEGRLYFAGDFTEGTHSDDAGNSAIRVFSQIFCASTAILATEKKDLVLSDLKD